MGVVLLAQKVWSVIVVVACYPAGSCHVQLSTSSKVDKLAASY